MIRMSRRRMIRSSEVFSIPFGPVTYTHPIQLRGLVLGDDRCPKYTRSTIRSEKVMKLSADEAAALAGLQTIAVLVGRRWCVSCAGYCSSPFCLR